MTAVAPGNKASVLFVSHDASRTGAPIVLLEFLAWLKEQEDITLTILLRRADGDLLTAFESIAPTYRPVFPGKWERRFRKLGASFLGNQEADVIPEALKSKSFDLVYLNTVVCLDLAPRLKELFRCPVICHVHENEYTLHTFYRSHTLPRNLQPVDHFIAVSESTRQALIGQLSVAYEKISLVYEFINPERIKTATIAAADIKRSLEITSELIIGGSGIAGWRKGTDWFLQLGLLLGKLRPGQIKMIWVGEIGDEIEGQLKYEASRLDIDRHFIFTGTKQQPQNYFQLFDVFALTSREDPFPLVAIEAASIKKPVICFDRSGGMAEAISHRQNGLVVPYGDVEAMAAEIIRILDNPVLRHQMGEASGKLAEKYEVRLAGKKLLGIIRQTINAYPWNR
ncbi:glycosyltransferase family 4 protein [Hufsiella ginkgonis]|uniref:Glycosyltransferase n=1 Tax=Hufsiella ginkgonis TaxID=2695274 RepID=A0A7K1Y2H2_9SPHI|nr:glycosyltransferase family 4 protein [Hufsiella ginkgonis]MXV17460.1 glycosyltransferase [Hufsiella ginkgonis]